MGYVNLMEIVYPVGTVYFSLNNTSPALMFGGTWNSLNANDRYLRLMSDSSAGTGGTNTLPAHNHPLGNNGFACASYTNTNELVARALPNSSELSSWAVTWRMGGTYGNTSSGQISGGTCLYGVTEDGGGVDYIPAYQGICGWVRIS